VAKCPSGALSIAPAGLAPPVHHDDNE
jgi:hypothetical protein